MAPRRASSVGLRGIAPTSARVDAQPSPKRPVNRPSTNSTTVTPASSSRRSGRRAPDVSVSVERTRWRARNVA